MKNFNFIYRTFLICSFGILLSNCEDGDIGPAGEDGIHGVDANDGTDGTNGIGFEDLVKYGSITLTLEGTRPDDITFSKALEFKYTPNVYDSRVYIEDTDFEYYTKRHLDSSPDSYVSIDYTIQNNGEETEEVNFTLNINNFSIISDDLTYFEISNGKGYRNNGLGISNFSITNYSYNEETNNLVYSFSFDVAGDNNNTGNALKVSGEVNTILLKYIGEL